MNNNVLQLRVNKVHYIDFEAETPRVSEIDVACSTDFTNMQGDDWIAFHTKNEAEEFLTMYHAARFALQKALANIH